MEQNAPGILDENKQNGNGDYSPEFLKEMAEQGIHLDGLKVMEQGGLQLLSSAPQRLSAVHYLAAVANASAVYKDDPMMAALIDNMYRTVFLDRRERVAFLNYLSWVIEFEQPVDYAYWWIIAAPAEGGRSRAELVQAVTTVNYQQRFFQHGSNKRANRNDPGISNG